MPELSRSQADKLGRHLRRSGVEGLSDQDRGLLERLLASYETPLGVVQARLVDTLGLPLTSRIKTTGTLIEKLERSRGMALSRMQDIAGVRLVAEMNRADQDRLVARILELFPGAEVKDRRAEPSHGYRAVHVIVEVDQRFVEIQVRTVLQDVWAQLIERFGDWWGRGIRYGELPNDPDKQLTGGWTRRMLFEAFMAQSERIHTLEEIAVNLAKLETDFESHPPTPKELEVFQMAKQEHQALEKETRALYKAVGLLK
jgi:hypothetical protein